MPPRRSQFSLTSWTFIASVAGLAAGRLLAYDAEFFAGWFLLQSIRLLAGIALASASCLAIPLAFASIVAGAEGLEPMRGVGRLTLKTGAWIVASSAVAALTGLAVAVILRPGSSRVIPSAAGFTGGEMWGASLTGKAWIVCVLIALPIGVYRNQIEEIRSRLLLRFSLAIDETLTLLLETAAGAIPVVVFLVAAATAGDAAWDFPSNAHRLFGLVGALAVATVMYGLFLLPLILWAFARVHPGQYALAVAPALLAAASGGSPAQVFPLTLTRLRVQVGVSNRVGGVVLAGCAALLRDGQALGWAVLAVWVIPSNPHATLYVQIFLLAWLFGCAAAAIGGPAAPLLLTGAVGEAFGPTHGVLLVTGGALMTLLGNVISVFSHTCAAAIIARSEGETNLLPPRPPAPPFADIVLETGSTL
jgi:proton glutamate symport protein